MNIKKTSNGYGWFNDEGVLIGRDDFTTEKHAQLKWDYCLAIWNKDTRKIELRTWVRA